MCMSRGRGCVEVRSGGMTKIYFDMYFPLQLDNIKMLQCK